MPPKTIELTTQQTEWLATLGNEVAQAKLRVYTANVELEKWRTLAAKSTQEVDTAMSRYLAARDTLAYSEGVSNPQVSPDFKTITGGSSNA